MFSDRAMMEVIEMADVELMTDSTLQEVKEFVLTLEGEKHKVFKQCKEEQHKRAKHYYD